MSIRKKNNDIFFGFSKVDLVADQHFVLTAAIIQRRERERVRKNDSNGNCYHFICVFLFMFTVYQCMSAELWKFFFRSGLILFVHNQ